MDLVLRFVIGGLVVSAFAALGELWRPKTFSGLFGAAPTVALASLALAFHEHGADYVQTAAQTMMLGGLAMTVYCATLVVLTRQRHFPVWLGAVAAWLVWLATAGLLFGALA